MGKASRKKHLRRESRHHRRLTVEQAQARECLFCRQSDGGFQSIEHIVPESLGNTDLVLNAGVVCDRCNNEQLSELDQTLCEFKPIKAMRTLRKVKSKKGVVPTTKTAKGTIEWADEDTVLVKVGRGQNMVRAVGTVGDQTQLEVDTSGGPKLDEKYAASLTRALLKMGLALVWHDYGTVALDAKYDHVREAVLGAPFAGRLAVAKKGLPGPSITVAHRTLEDGSQRPPFVVVIDVFGIQMAGGIAVGESNPDFSEQAILVDFGNDLTE